MSRRRLTIQYGGGFSTELWGWKVTLVQAPSGRVEVVWETQSFEPTTTQRVHRFRARALPEWWPEVNDALDAVDFDELPPVKRWDIWMDDADVLSVERQENDAQSRFSVFYSPQWWPTLRAGTREALQKVVSILEPIARRLHGTGQGSTHE